MVDSLCIIQDDRDDWLRESSRMARIYSRSTLTLATHLCEKSSESFLQKLLLQQHLERPAHPPGDLPASFSGGPEPLSENATRLAYTDMSTGKGRVLHLWRDGGNEAVRFLNGGWAKGHLEFSEKRTSWLHRAWALQEWLLSPRVLQYVFPREMALGLESY